MPTSPSQIEEQGASASVRFKRTLIDQVTGLGVRVGGIVVISAVLLIFLYLFIVIAPLFVPASLSKAIEQPNIAVGAGSLVDLSMSHEHELAVTVMRDGVMRYYARESDEPIAIDSVPVPPGLQIVAVLHGPVGSGFAAFALSDGRVIVVRQRYTTAYETRTRRTVSPKLEYPLGVEPIAPAAWPQASLLALSNVDDQFILVWGSPAGGLIVAFVNASQNLLGETSTEFRELSIDAGGSVITHAQVSGDHRWLIAATDGGDLRLLALRGALAGKVLDQQPVAEAGDQVADIQGLLGGASWIVATQQGGLEQWMPVRDEAGSSRLAMIRVFRESGPMIRALESEQRRKGFLALDASHHVAIYSPAASREVLNEPLGEVMGGHIALSAGGAAMVTARADGGLTWWNVDNEFPEVSWSALWDRVWYEGYEEPKYIWQSSAASDDVEPKYSFMPLTFGTIKAAFYAMLVAVPLAIFAAIYTGYFMSRHMRNWVKPSIELMEALPTVILGFLAGLWLAPFLENHLPGVIALFLLLPLVMAAFGLLWYFLPMPVHRMIPDGWQALALIPVVLVVAWSCFYLSIPIEHQFFSGDMRVWLENHGIDYDERNAMVVGFAMGFAIIPTIFSISEDAVFNVPGHLIDGSHALGATAWQTLIKVVIPTASPAIFSALMIGLGRAVGETMIVLMAAGNTPIMDWNIFEGMRTLAANVAVEMPETEVDSTHYRLLFLTAFVLLLFTFLLNSLAELIRYHLRKKYSSL